LSVFPEFVKAQQERWSEVLSNELAIAASLSAFPLVQAADNAGFENRSIIENASHKEKNRVATGLLRVCQKRYNLLNVCTPREPSILHNHVASVRLRKNKTLQAMRTLSLIHLSNAPEWMESV